MKTCLTLSFIALIFSVSAQLVTFPAPSPLMGQYDFLGPNYLVTNSTFTGNWNAIGHFDATNTNLGLTKGIILSTGVVQDNGNGPHGPNNQSDCGTSNHYPTNSSISDLYMPGVSTYDMAELSIEFVPAVDSLKIKFVFGSDEYPEYVNQPFNDFFVVRLFKNNIIIANNIAALPNNNFVAVNNVNNGSSNAGPCNNCFYYLANGYGTNSPYDTNNQYVQFDGLTQNTFIYASGLEIGASYRMDIYIADVYDEIYDSGVFIESYETCSFNVGVKEEILDGIHFYPNPVNEKLVIEGGKGVQYSIIDIQGNVFQKGSLVQNSQEILIDKLQAGIYFLRLTNGTSTKTEKLIVE